MAAKIPGKKQTARAFPLLCRLFFYDHVPWQGGQVFRLAFFTPPHTGIVSFDSTASHKILTPHTRIYIYIFFTNVVMKIYIKYTYFYLL